MKAKTLLFDLETSMATGYFFGRTYETNIVHIIEDSYMFCYSWKWLGESTVHNKALSDYPGYTKGSSNEKKLLKDLHALLSEADFVIGQNSDNFDIKFANARFMVHGFDPPKPFKQIDTLKMSRSTVNLPSHKLDEKGRYFDGDGKLSHEGKALWMACMNGDLKAWKKMKAYCNKDIILLERDYLRFRPWVKNHPNINVVTRRPESCPVCSSTRIQSRGFDYNRTSERPRYQCMSCGKWCNGPWEPLAVKVKVV